MTRNPRIGIPRCVGRLPSFRGACVLSVFVGVVLSAASGVAQQSCTGDLPTIGVLPLCDSGSSTYVSGFVGGLYPAGQNTRPAAHFASGLTIAENEVVPRDGTGAIDLVNGRIGLVSIGMSNTTQEFAQGPDTFKPRMEADPTLSPFVTIVDGAQGGQAAANWVYGDGPWNVLEDRVTDAGLTANQIQVAWIKTAKRLPSALGGFPNHAEILQQNIRDILTRLRAEYPQLRMAFLSSRTRAYTDDPMQVNPEPFAFESGFASRWAIEDQVAGMPGMDFTAEVPWICWGPYIWIDGVVPRSDGLVWLTTDVSGDCTHPSSNGRVKVSDQLVGFFKADPLTVPWFLRDPVAADAPTVTVTPSTTSGLAPLTVDFVVSASSPIGATISDFAWHFDDGTTSLEQSPTKVFPVPGTYDVRLTVSADDGNHTTIATTITVLAPVAAPVIVSPGPVLEGLSLGQFEVTTFTATGSPALSWSVSGGALPSGLTLSPDGVFSGTPTQAGLFSFDVTVTNAQGMDSMTFTGEVIDPDLIPKVDVEADAYVRDGSLASMNFGSEDQVAVRGSTMLGQNVVSYLRFSLPAGLISVETASLNLLFSESIGGVGDVSVYFVADDNWGESTVNWDNRPALTTFLETVFVVNLGITYAWDVTTVVNDALQGDGVVTFALVDDTLASPIMFFDSKEGAFPPFLSYEEGVVADAEFIRGDANADGTVDLGDAVAILGSIFAPAVDPCLDMLDVNDDGTVDVSDPVSLLGFLFASDPAPGAPFPGCGLDPSADALPCSPFGFCQP